MSTKSSLCNDGIHRFEPRYDKSEPIIAQGYHINGMADGTIEDVIERFRRLTYVRDICVRCGAVVERSS